MATVTVGCKWGPGLNIRIGAFHEITVTDRFGGFRQEKQWRPEKTIAIKGPNQKGAIQTQDGYALTHGVDADEFALWLDANKDLDLVRNGLIEAHEKPNELRAMTREGRETKTGIEPLALDDKGRMVDARIPKPASGGGIQTERIGELAA
jgi:hypothetical protein